MSKRVPVVLMLSETEVAAHLSRSSLNPELSQFIVLELIWPSSGTFQRYHQLTSADTAPCLRSVGSTATSAPVFAANFECVLRTSLIDFVPRFFRAARSSGVFVERPRSLEQAGCPLGNKSELSHLNDGIATGRVSHYTQCTAT